MILTKFSLFFFFLTAILVALFALKEFFFVLAKALFIYKLVLKETDICCSL